MRSGKSRLAERLAHESGLPVVYVATARADDAEMTQRIARHRERRSADWQLVEEPLALAAVLARECAPERCLLVDCLTLWLTNWLMTQDDLATDGDMKDPLLDQIRTLIGTVATAPGRLILVGNETSMGIVPLGALTRRFCDLTGLLHQGLAEHCDQVILSVAGLPLALKGETP